MAGLLGSFVIALLSMSLTLGEDYDYGCETITIPYCTGDSSFTPTYQTTRLPNRHGHGTQEQVEKALNDFASLIESNCSESFRHFLCAEYLPACDLYGDPVDLDEYITPCKELCLQARNECRPRLRQFRQQRKQEGKEYRSIKWPRTFKCRNYNGIFASGSGCVMLW